jgi:hypothetical protein
MLGMAAGLLPVTTGAAADTTAATPVNTERAPPAGDLPAAPALIEAMRESQQTSGFQVRARVESKRDGAPPGEARVVQLMAKGRQHGEQSQLLVVGMWPDDVRGEAIMVARDGGGELSGFSFTPALGSSDISAADLSRPLFGTPLTANDLEASFWHWPSQRTTSRERVGERECWIIESRQAADVRYPLVRSCVGVEEGIPLKLERFDEAGRRLARITFDRLVRREDGSWAPAVFTIESVPSAMVTEIRFSRSDRDQQYPAADFTPDAVRALIGVP